MIARTRVARLLAGYRDRAPARLEDVASALVSLSDLVIDFPQITELDINPLIADSAGVIALDARIIVTAKTCTVDRLAIRPYPTELTQTVGFLGPSVVLRAIKPDDATRLLDFAKRTHRDDLRMRFHGTVSLTSPAAATRLSQIDYNREMVFVVQLNDASLSGIVRLIFDPNFESAECAIIVRTDMQRRTIGRTLLRAALAYAKSRGARRLWGDVLDENSPILGLSQRLGGRLQPLGDDLAVTRVEFELDPHSPN
jgi:acetyltransferase